MKRRFLILLYLILNQLDIHAQNGFTIEYQIQGIDTSMVYLNLTKGSNHLRLDSAYSSNGRVEFAMKNRPTGVYRLEFADSLYTDIIYNQENVKLRNNLSDLASGLEVVESAENQIFYRYWKQSQLTSDSIGLVAGLANAIYEVNGHVFTPELDSMRRLVMAMQKRLDDFTLELIRSADGLFVKKILRAYMVPDWEAFKKNHPDTRYKNKYAFLQDHYFDHIDFGDSLLLNTEIFYVSCTDYVVNYCDPPGVDTYISATSRILEMADSCKPVYEYILGLFMNTFENSEWEDVWAYLVSEWYLRDACTSDTATQNMQQKLEYFKKLKPGNPAPEIKMKNPEGVIRSLYDLKNPLILIFFWSPACPHCVASIPQLVALYNKYHASGFEIFAVSVSEDKTAYPFGKVHQ